MLRKLRFLTYLTAFQAVFFVVLYFVNVEHARTHYAWALFWITSSFFFTFILLSPPARRLETTHGSARYATKREIDHAGLVARSGVLIGRWNKKILRYGAAGHIVTIAPTRTGKGLSAVIPNLLKFPGSVFVLDLKGDNFAVTARARQQMGQEVHAIDPLRILTKPPFNLSGVESSSFDPISWMRPNVADCERDASAIAEALIYAEGASDEKANHFLSLSRQLLTSALIFVKLYPKVEKVGSRTLAGTLTLLNQSGVDFLQLMLDWDDAPLVVQNTASNMLRLSTDETGSIYSTTTRFLEWVVTIYGQAATAPGGVDMTRLVSGRMSVYVCLPKDDQDKYRGYLRLLAMAAISSHTRARGREDTLFMLDEIAQLGYFEPVAKGIALAAGYGIIFWLIFQDLSQIEGAYGKQGAGSILSNAAVQQYFGVAHRETAEHLSRTIGKTTILTRASDGDWAQNDIDQNKYRMSETSRDLLTPDEIMAGLGRSQLLFIRGLRPIVARRLDYRREKECRGLFDKNPLEKSS